MEKKGWRETDRKALSFVRIYWLAMGEVHYCSQTLSTADIRRSALCASKDHRTVFASPALHPAKPFVVLNRPRSTLITYTLNCANKQLEAVLI